MNNNNFTELLQQGVEKKIITIAQAHSLLHNMRPPLSEVQKAIITILHDLFCTLDHRETEEYKAENCIFRSEEERTECWDLPSHQIWINVYHSIIREHQPTDDKELLIHLNKARALLNNTHQTALFFVTSELNGLPYSYFCNQQEQEQEIETDDKQVS